MRTLYRILLLVLGISVCVFSYSSVIENKNKILETLDHQPSYNFSPRVIELISLGYNTVAADMLWMSMGQYIGIHASDGRYPHLGEYLGTIVSIDPQFFAPYRLSIILLPDAGLVEEAISIGEKGISEFPDDPELPFFHAYNYYAYKHDYESAAKWFTYAATRPNALKASRSLAALNLAKLGKFDVARAVWHNVYETSKDSTTQERALIKMQQYDNLILIERAINRYYEHFETYPEKVESLVAAGYLESVPVDPIDSITYIIDPETHLPDSIKTRSHENRSPDTN